jgi:hypothetical protein
VIDDREYGPYQDVIPSITFSRDGKHFMTGVADQKGGWRMLVDGDLKGSYAKIGSHFFTDDQSERICIAADKNGGGIYIGDQRLNVEIPETTMAYHFSKDAKKLAYVREENGEVWRRILTLRSVEANSDSKMMYLLPPKR